MAQKQTTEKKKAGRPPKAKQDKQAKRITVYLTPREFERFQEMASEAGVSLAEIVMRPWREKEE